MWNFRAPETTPLGILFFWGGIFLCFEGERGPKHGEIGGSWAPGGRGGGSGWDVSGEILYLYAFFLRLNSGRGA